MKMNAKLVLLGMEGKTAKSGNDYVVGLFQQGTDTLRSMVKIEKLPTDLKAYQEYDVELSYSTYQGQIRLDVTDIKKAV